MKIEKEIMEVVERKAVPDWVYEIMYTEKEITTLVHVWDGFEWRDRKQAKKPKKLTLDRIKKFFAENPDRYAEVNRHLCVKHERSKLERLLDICTYVVHADTNFQNLNSETKAAEVTAQRVLKLAEDMVSIIETVTQEEAAVVIKILEVMDLCYVRVFGDTMERIPFQGTNLENWIRTIYRNPRLVSLREKEDIMNMIFNNQK